MFTGLEHEKKDKLQRLQRNEMQSLYVLPFVNISKNEK